METQSLALDYLAFRRGGPPSTEKEALSKFKISSYCFDFGNCLTVSIIIGSMNTACTAEFGNVLFGMFCPTIKKHTLHLVMSASKATACSSSPSLVGGRGIFKNNPQPWQKDPLSLCSGCNWGDSSSRPGDGDAGCVEVGKAVLRGTWTLGPLLSRAKGSLKLSQLASINSF